MADATAPAPRDPAPASVRGRIAHLSPVQAELLRSLHGRARRWSSASGLLRLRGGRPGPADSVFEVDADGVRLGLRLTAPPAAPDDALQWQDRRGRARILAWSLAQESALVRLSEALGTSLLPLLDPAPSPGDELIWLDFDLAAFDDAAPALSGSLRAPAAWLAALLARAAESEPALDLGHWRQLPTVAAIALTAPPLTLADLRSLRPGDVVVVGHPRLPPLHASAAGLRWPLRAATEGWRVDGPPSPQSRFQETFPMTESDTPVDAAPDAPAEDPAARLPVEVAFELGKVELRLGDIAGLQPGYVFALPAHLEGANVTIRANGRVAGQGEVVAVGDTLGVRVLSWS